MKIIPGVASKDLAEKVSEELNEDLVPVERERFPDGEIYVRFEEDLEDERIVIVQSTCYPPNQNYMELFFMIDAAKDLGAEKVEVVMPYFGYARQDKRFEPGEAVSLNTVAKLLESSGADEIYTMDYHPQQMEETPEVFDIPAHNLTASDLLAEHVEENFDLKNPVVLGPDAGAENWARKAGEAIGADWDFMMKKRLDSEDVEITLPEIDVEGRDVLLVDDIISTGGTMCEAIMLLKENRARDVYACCTHPVLSGDALENIMEAGALEIIGTDTIESEVSEVSVAPVIAEAILQ